MNRDQYINEVRRKSLVLLFNAARRIIAHPLNRTSYGELRAAGCTALDYATEGKVPRYITGTEAYCTPSGYTVFPKQRTNLRWAHGVQGEAYGKWENQRPLGASGYWWYMEISMGAAQYRLRAIDNIIKDLTPAAVSRNKREGKYIDRLNWFKRGQMVHFYGGRANGRYRKYIANWTVVSNAVQSALI